MTIRFRALAGLVVLALYASSGAAKTGICAADSGPCYLFSQASDGTGNLLVVFHDGNWTSEIFTGSFGRPGDIPVVGDWDGDGVQDIGVYSDGYWHLRTRQPDQIWSTTTVFYFGSANPLAKPVVGDWNGDGKDSVGIVMGIRWVLRSNTGDNPSPIIFDFGSSAASPLVGDWNGDGIDTPARVDGGKLHYRNTLQYNDPDTGAMTLPSFVVGTDFQPLAWRMRWTEGADTLLDVIAFIDPKDGLCSGLCNGDGAVVVVPGPGSH